MCKNSLLRSLFYTNSSIFVDVGVENLYITVQLYHSHNNGKLVRKVACVRYSFTAELVFLKMQVPRGLLENLSNVKKDHMETPNQTSLSNFQYCVASNPLDFIKDIT